MSSFELLTLEFVESFPGRDIRLIEVDENVAAHVHHGGNISILGNVLDKDAVLCTISETYTMKRVETSNHVFIAQDSYIHAQSNYHYELSPTAPHPSSQVLETLRQSALKSTSEERNEKYLKTRFLDRNELQTMMLCSDAELLKMMDQLGIIEINGKMRMVSISALVEVLAEMLDVAVINGWDLRIHQQECTQALPSTDSNLIEFALNHLGSRLDISSGVWELIPEKVFQACARVFIHLNSTRKQVSI